MAGAISAPAATSALTFDFGLPGTPGYQANQEILRLHGNGADHAPVLFVSSSRDARLTAEQGDVAADTVLSAVVSWADDPALLSDDACTGVTIINPPVRAGTADAYDEVMPRQTASVNVRRALIDLGFRTRVLPLDPDPRRMSRAGPIPAGACLEIGFGTRLLTPILELRWHPVVAVDLSMEMLKLGRAGLRCRPTHPGCPLPTERRPAQ